MSNRGRKGNKCGYNRVKKRNEIAMRGARAMEIAGETLNALQVGFYLNEKKEKVEIQDLVKFSIENSVHYDYKFDFTQILHLENKKSYDTKFFVGPETTFGAVEEIYKTYPENITVLNFASGKNPGGGFLRGTTAQEECLARSSGLYPTLIQFDGVVGKYYSINKQKGVVTPKCLYTSCAIFSPKVPILRKDTLDDAPFLEKPIPCSIITIPAPNRGQIIKSGENNSDVENLIVSTLEDRIDRILSMAIIHGSVDIVLGAFGCGVFGNEPHVVAQIFKSKLTTKFKNKFRNVYFAIYVPPPRPPQNDKNFQAFAHLFAPH